MPSLIDPAARGPSAGRSAPPSASVRPLLGQALAHLSTRPRSWVGAERCLRAALVALGVKDEEAAKGARADLRYRASTDPAGYVAEALVVVAIVRAGALHRDDAAGEVRQLLARALGVLPEVGVA